MAACLAACSAACLAACLAVVARMITVGAWMITATAAMIAYHSAAGLNDKQSFRIFCDVQLSLLGRRGDGGVTSQDCWHAARSHHSPCHTPRDSRGFGLTEWTCPQPVCHTTAARYLCVAGSNATQLDSELCSVNQLSHLSTPFGSLNGTPYSARAKPVGRQVKCCLDLNYLPSGHFPPFPLTRPLSHPLTPYYRPPARPLPRPTGRLSTGPPASRRPPSAAYGLQSAIFSTQHSLLDFL